MVVVKREVVQLCSIPELCYINDCTLSAGSVYFTDSFHPVLYSMPRWPGEHGSRNVHRHTLGHFFDTKLGQFRANGLAVLATNTSSDILLVANTHTGNLYVVEIQQVTALDKSSAALTLAAKHQSGALAAALMDATIDVMSSSIGALASLSSSVGHLVMPRNVTRQQKKQSQVLVTELELPTVRGMVAGHLLLDGVWAINSSFVYVSDNMNNRIFGVTLQDDLRSAKLSCLIQQPAFATPTTLTVIQGLLWAVNAHLDTCFPFLPCPSHQFEVIGIEASRACHPGQW